MAQNGITSLQDAIVTPETLAAYGRLEKGGDMTFRLRAAMVEPASENPEDIAEHLQMLLALREEYKDYRYIAADAVKLFADAVLEGNPLSFPPALPVAAILGEFQQPIFGGSIEDGSFDIQGYVDQGGDTCIAVRNDKDRYLAREALNGFVSEFGYYPQQCIPQSGVLEHDEVFIRRYIREATEAGFNVHVHALSDRAVRIAVDEFAKVKKTADRLATSQSLAHLQLVHPDDQRRIGELGIASVFTFVWTIPDRQYEMMVIPFIDRVAGIEDLYNPDSYYMQNVYPARSLQEQGALLVNGSDAPVGNRDPMPFVSLQAALTRSDGEFVLNAAQRIDIDSAIKAFTLNGARMFGHEDRLGSI
ncbi:MAG: amidohydrolase family protein, partial [Congregibacter sp.]|nr:amidohydrolase family protein [Congregibacter sp.]